MTAPTKRDWHGRALPTHGYSGTRTHNTWLQMRARCINPKHQNFHRYGARGIQVCARWDSFENFLADMGEQAKDAKLERIDNNGNYEPSNCKWATHREQMNNTRRNRFFTFRGETKTGAEWARATGIKYDTLMARFRRWTPERALTKGIQRHG